MSLFKRFFVLSGILLSLNQCTLRPLYATQKTESSEHLAYVKIANIEGRLGQIMRNSLLQKITPQGQPRNPLYILEVTLNFSDRDLGVAKDATATRSEVSLSANYTLKDYTTGKVLYTGKEVENTDYNILTSSYYSNIVSKNNAQEGVVEFMSNLIKLSLASYLNSTQNR